MFELKPVEIIVPVKFTEAGKPARVTHIFTPPSAQHWLDFENALKTKVEESDGTSQWRSEQLEASEQLWDKCALRVAGYLMRTPAGDREELFVLHPTEFRAKVPLNHKVAGVQGLAQVAVADEVSDETAYYFDMDAVVIKLESARNGAVFTGLSHRLRRPTPQELKEFSRAAASTVFVRGSRKPVTLLPSRLKQLIDLYDRLVLGTLGYSVNGQPAVSAGEARDFMDAMHKKAAVQALFAPDDSGPEEVTA